MNIYQKIVKVREVAGGFNKDKKGYDYDYVTGNQILAKVKDKMNELNLLLIPETDIGEWRTYDYTTSKGKEKTDFVISGKMRYVWIDGDSEERLEVPWAYYGQQDDISKAYGSALTYSERYFWLKCLGLPTDDDDPDSRQGNNGVQTSAKTGKGNGNKVDAEMLKQIKNRADEVGLNKKDLIDMAKDMFGVEKSHELTQEQAIEFDKALIEKLEMQEAS
ncbi:MAG: hypothetical protein AVO34_13410 [Firmicutes bacterium ML8_F2]|jgi:hypothetical protein|nr:MAG: hypothetical protein AVO34_13410 [Firmicutes bacterium ML8_F2]